MGLERRHSGRGRAQVQVVQQVNRLLRGVRGGAAKRASSAKDNPYAAQ
jgi:hypothetical protein